MRYVKTVVWVFGSIVLGANASAELSETDQTNLTICLDTLLHGWDQPCVDLANTILPRPEYTEADWVNSFGDYFITTNHAFTDKLREYLLYPVFGWFDDVVHLKFQNGLVDAMWAKANASAASYPADLGM